MQLQLAYFFIILITFLIIHKIKLYEVNYNIEY